MKNIKSLVLLLFSFSSFAAVIDITAEYKPESYDINGGRFINTTPCDMGVEKDYCDPQKPLEASVIVKLPVSITKTINSAKGKQSYINYYRMTGPQKVTLSNSRNGERHELMFIPTHIGVKASNMSYPLVNDDKWPMSNIGGDCLPRGVAHGWWLGSYVTQQLNFFSIKDAAQNGPSECFYNSAHGDGTSYKVEWITYGFRFKSPNPLTMSNGKYTGSLKIMVGRNKDIDLGDATYSGGTEHELKFTLTVRHQLRVDFPKGGDDGHSQVTLLPPGGWNDYTNTGRVPRILQRDLPFRLWASAPFTVTLRCQYLYESECSLKMVGKGNQVVFNTYFITAANKMIRMTTIPVRFEPTKGPIINGARAIQFRVVGEEIKEMMKHPGYTYKGWVTLIFDSSID
ncbi:hypothetical protein [Aeromonas veronii]|uniref:hypothetical protein n=1 Tax=Aeromonas veronii TaxID=654 RepID=UPI003BA1F4C3